MSLIQIRELDRIVRKRHIRLRRELKILEIKKIIYNKIQLLLNDIVDVSEDIIKRFIYDKNDLAYAKKR